MMDVKISKDKHIGGWVDQGHLICVRWNSINRLYIKTKKVTDSWKRSKTLNEVKPVENLSMNPKSFLEISLLQKEVLPSYKLQDHAYE